MRNKLRILYFLQFAVWGSYLTSFGQFLGSVGMGMNIAWFYAAIGLVSLVTPPLFGHLADRYIAPVRLLRLCHFLAGCTMLSMFIYAQSQGRPEFGPFFTLYMIFLAFYMPTMALSNTVTFGLLKERSIRPVDAFPAIRVWGTVGFIMAMWLVNSIYIYDGEAGFTLSDAHPYAMQRFQYNAGQLLSAAFFGFATALYAVLIPRHQRACDNDERHHSGNFITQIKSLKYFFSLPELRIFLIFAIFTGVCLQISNGFVTSFITHFVGDPQYSENFAASNATLLFSLSQISEMALILIVGISLKRLGIRGVFAIGILAWCIRYVTLAFGTPADGAWLLILSMIVYGVAFNFITIAGHLYVEDKSPARYKGFGQGAMMLMSNGIGATVGMLCAGNIINRFCQWQPVSLADGDQTMLFMGAWETPWLIFSGYAAVVLIAWIIFFRTKKVTSH